MKKFQIIGILCVLAMIFCLAACSASNETETAESSNLTEETQQTTLEIQDEKTENTTESSIDVNETEMETEIETCRILVAYFSATGTTKNLAEYAADAMGADLYEIVPEQPYTDADLDYSNSNSRSTVEMNDPSARPVISGNVENMEQYDIVFIAYPIWWGEAPRIVSTFMESYDFSEKTIVPFCTSSSSGLGSSAINLHSLVSDSAVWLDGDRLASSSSRDDMVEWINGLGLDIKAE